MPPRKAMILAAGFGKRLAPLTAHRPKALLPVGGKPLIVWQIEKLVRAGIRRLIINTHYRAEQLVAALGDGTDFGVRIQWSHEPQILDTGGGIQAALPLLGAEPFLVVNADIWSDYDFTQLLQPPAAGSLAHLVLVPNPPEHPQGDFVYRAQPGLRLKPGQPTATYAGIARLSPEFIRTCAPPAAAFPLLHALQTGIARGQVTAELHAGQWQDVGTPARLRTLDHMLSAARHPPP
ncbi:MAG: nucleotidyltransferase family protein [Cellvibrionales bacterium]|nr:nucleotidyltransferase family protein [Cellvibrionales bacterium]